MDQPTTANKTGSASVPGPQFVTVPVSEPPTKSKPVVPPVPPPPKPPAATSPSPAHLSSVASTQEADATKTGSLTETARESPPADTFTLGGNQPPPPEKKSKNRAIPLLIILLLLITIPVALFLVQQTQELRERAVTYPCTGDNECLSELGSTCCSGVSVSAPECTPTGERCEAPAGGCSSSGTCKPSGGTCCNLTMPDTTCPSVQRCANPASTCTNTGDCLTSDAVNYCCSGSTEVDSNCSQTLIRCVAPPTGCGSFAQCPEGQCSNIYPGDVCTTIGTTQCVGSTEVVCTGPLTRFCSLNYWASTGQVCSDPGGGGGDQCCIQNGQTVCNSTCNTGSSSISWDGNCFINLTSDCFGQVYTCNGNTPGGCSSGGVAGTCFSAEGPSMCDKTQQIDVECSGDSEGAVNPPDYFRSKYFSCTTTVLKTCNETCINDSECETGLTCLPINGQNVCWGTTCEAPSSPSPGPSSSPGSSPPSSSPSPSPVTTAQCIDIRIYQVTGDISDAANWTRLDSTQMAALQSGDTIYISTLGSVSGGTIDRARIRVNSDVWTVTNETNTLKPKAVTTDPDEYYVAYTIPPLTNTFTFGAEIHEAATDRWY